MAGVAVDADVAVHHAHQLLANGEPQAGAAKAACGARLRLREAVEQFGLCGLRDTNAAVRHLDQEADLAFRLDGVLLAADDDLAGLGELDGVGEQVEQNLLDAAAVAAQKGVDLRVDVADDLQLLLGRDHHHRVERLLHRCRDVEVGALQVQLSRFDALQVQDVVNQLQKRVGAALRQLDELALVALQLPAQQHLVHADDAIQRRAHLVAHVRQEGALRFVGRSSAAELQVLPLRRRCRRQLIHRLRPAGVATARRCRGSAKKPH
mmetsp:Transcript_23833/g.61891  ORF Transcript_23833/g.61891 Transcript_23833/m.61891 type:complete len:265 (+) Transcript_23833:4351-5145(+)